MDAVIAELFFHRYTPKHGDIVVELGAYRGFETAIMAVLVGPEGVVVGVEPHPQHFLRLSEECAPFSNVRLVEAAVVHRPGRVVLADVGNCSFLTLDEGLEVEAQTLDQITSDLPRVDFLKINIEGSEVFALSGGENTLRKTRNVVVSCHDFLGMKTREDTFTLLVEAGFDVVPHGNPLVFSDGHSGACIGGYLYGTRS